MKPKLMLCLALALGGGLFGCSSIASADEINAAQSYVTATVKASQI
jgi:hypothetical protein